MVGSRALLSRLYAAALAGADPESAVRRALAREDVERVLSRARRIGVFAVGKAAARMAAGASAVPAVRRLVILPRGHPAPGLARGEALLASHPEPDASSARAARRALAFFRGFGPGDVILCLVSGGTSSLLALPRPGLTLSEKRRRVRACAASGASILALNRLRTALSAVKGGRLGDATRARLVTLALSDVPGDRAASVGSGPTVRGRRGDLERIVGSNRSGLAAATALARRLGVPVEVLARRLSGEARAAGRRIARAAERLPPGAVLLGGGETTVALGTRAGRGGRNLELALGAAMVLDGEAGWMLLAASSDGLDGSSGAAGAFADGFTVARARRAGLLPEAALRRHDTRPFFAAAGDLFVTGPTGGNVGDWVFLLRNPARRRPV